MPRTTVIGVLMGLGIISGAIFFHLTVLSIEVMHDGGQHLYMPSFFLFVAGYSPTCIAPRYTVPGKHDGRKGYERTRAASSLLTLSVC